MHIQYTHERWNTYNTYGRHIGQMSSMVMTHKFFGYYSISWQGDGCLYWHQRQTKEQKSA